MGKSDESLRRKATGPVKWQPVAKCEESTAHEAVLFCFLYYTYPDIVCQTSLHIM